MAVYISYFRIARDSDTKRSREGLKRPFWPSPAALSSLEFQQM